MLSSIIEKTINMKQKRTLINNYFTPLISRNLFDINTAIPNSFVNWVTGDISSNDTYIASDYIEIEPNTQYMQSGHGQSLYMAWYDADKIFISGNNSVTYPLTSPSNAKYMRITFQSADHKYAQLEKGTVYTGYIEHTYVNPIISGNALDGMSWATLGDSVTALGDWQKVVTNADNLFFTNYGIGGSTISGTNVDSHPMNSDVRVNAIPTDTDIVSLMGGTNDWAQSFPLGEPNSTNVETFYGALNITIEKLQTRFSGKKIVLATMPFSKMTSYADRNWSDAYTNVAGLTPQDYANAVINRANAYGLPSIDVYNGCGWGDADIDTYVTYDGNYMHPNSAGQEIMGNLYVNAFKSI